MIPRSNVSRSAFFLSSGADTGGANIRASQAFLHAGGRSDWRVRSMVSSDNYIQYPHDLPWTPNSLAYHYDTAEVVVHSSTMFGHDAYDHGQGKPTILMHHGFHYDHYSQTVHEAFEDARDTGACQIGTTVNLELLSGLETGAVPSLSPEQVVWTPIPYPLETLREKRREEYRVATKGSQQIIRVGHAPTNREVKSTAAFLAAIDTLKSQGLLVEPLLIEKRTWAQTMDMKARYVDILVDQLKLGYGCNAIEAWGLGIPVIGGVSDHPDWREHMVSRFNLVQSPTGLPFYEANESNLAEKIRDLVENAEERRFWQSIGHIHVQNHHSERGYVQNMSQIFALTAQRRTRPSTQPRTFSKRQHLMSTTH